MLMPTLIDPTMAPEGKHYMSVFVQYCPYQLAEGPWTAERRQAHADPRDHGPARPERRHRHADRHPAGPPEPARSAAPAGRWQQSAYHQERSRMTVPARCSASRLISGRAISQSMIGTETR